MRNFHIFIGLLIISLGSGIYQQMDQRYVNEIASTLGIKWHVVTNTQEEMTYQVEVTLENNHASLTLGNGTWQIWFFSIFMVEPDILGVAGNKGAELPGQGVNVTHVQGSLFYFEPTPEFTPLKPGDKRKIKMKVRYWSASRTDVMPNWYLLAPGQRPAVIASTSDETLKFVTDKTGPQQWKRYNFDYYNPWTTQERYERYFIPGTKGSSERRLIPKPLHQHCSEETLHFDNTTWVVYYDDKRLESEATLLRDTLGLRVTNQNPPTKAIELTLGDVSVEDEVLESSTEAYSLLVDTQSQKVTITGREPAGVLYGITSLLALTQDGLVKEIPECEIVDSPRFGHRGLMLDIARNFHGKDEIIEIIQVMAKYKMNKLHLHLSNDEAWRIELPALPELTQLGARRCHDLTETTCLLPQLGSGPDNSTSFGSGHLSASDYIEVLREANKYHVTVIPETDMPGHARAAIKAMEQRVRSLNKTGQVQQGLSTSLTEPDDQSEYTNHQIFSDNAINPCLESTYTFVGIVMDQLKMLHDHGNQTLKTFHFGGDEVGPGAWLKSPSCQSLKNNGTIPEVSGPNIKAYFFKRLSQLAAQKDLSLAAWEDGLMDDGNTPFDINEELKTNQTVTAWAWDNVWDFGTISRTYTMANAGYKVVMAHGSHLFLDHPYEPDPEERGYYWATRYADTKKTFFYTADRFYDNILVKASGQVVSEEERCGEDKENCPPLLSPENILGMEATCFTETSRTKAQLQSKLFPRILAVAERSWHQAPWESLPPSSTRDHAREEDWADFARAVGEREMSRMSEWDLNYRIPPPGVKEYHHQIIATTEFPGLEIQYSFDGGRTWLYYDTPISLDDHRYRVWFRTKAVNREKFSKTVVFHPDIGVPVVNQPVVDYIAQHLDIHYTVADNIDKYGDNFFEAILTMKNTGNGSIPKGNWRIYFVSVQVIEPEFILKSRDYIDPVTNIGIAHEKGYLFSLGPAPRFTAIGAGQELQLAIKAQWWSASRYEQMPNWYVSAPGMEPSTIQSTAGESLSFVGSYDEPRQYKRMKADLFTPWSPAARYDRNENWNVQPLSSSAPIIPHPVKYESTGKEHFRLIGANVSVVYMTGDLKPVAEYFIKTLKHFIPEIKMELTSDQSAEDAIVFEISDQSQLANSSEAYEIKIDGKGRRVTVSGVSTAGVFYGAVSLIHLAVKGEEKGTLIDSHVMDWPRFPFRGMHVDTARNFIPKCAILNLLEVMALYKLNKFHFHLTDDEGWRLEIRDLPELTQVGAKRCHDPQETECVMSALGSGPDDVTSGSGFYTEEDYREILRFAEDRHIEVIPEIDMPGHAHSAIRAMRVREQRLRDLGQEAEAQRFTLDEDGDVSRYFSVQFYTDNAVNPCLDSTYDFISKVLSELQRMHADIQPLQKYHFGGDEVAKGAWLNSTACRDFVKKGDNLKKEFTRRVSQLTKNLTLVAWEDGLMEHNNEPWNRSLLANGDVIANTWDNVWEWGGGARAYTLANNGYKVVLCPATHMYFDQPQEPSPEERGFYWATRYTDTFKSFSFLPDNYYENADIQRSGEKISLEEICKANNKGCPPLEERNAENIIGIQGQLWSETVRQPYQFQYMVFPRLLALAERAWHRAEWEDKRDRKERRDGLFADWSRFSRQLGTKDLELLDILNVDYRVPPPGAKLHDNRIVANVEFPGLGIEYKIHGTADAEWHSFDPEMTFSEKHKVSLRTKTPLGKRHSEEISLSTRKHIVLGNTTSLIHLSPVSLIVLIFQCLYVIVSL